MASPSSNPAGPFNGESERAELASVLASGAFKRSPKLSRLLSYVCEKSLRGEGGQVTEYSIALDVLARDANFDPQVDSIVRVDMYHLRKRLKGYYEGEGKDDAIEIAIPSGRYVPEFVARLPAAQVNTLSVATPPLPASTPSQPRRWIAAGAILLVGLGLFAVARMLGHVQPPVSKSAPAILDNQDGIRILAGERAGDYIDKAGRVWLSDRFFTGGQTFHRAHAILRTQDPEMYQTGREGQFAYEIPLKPGVYQLQLYFAETGVASEGLRGVSLAINGIPHASLDVASDAGGADTATIKVYKDISPAKDGLLHLTFQSTGPSFVNAIEVLPGTPGKMRPLRFTARDSTFRDSAGQLWLPDLGFSGGRRSTREGKLSGTPDPSLYQVQRFGHFNYSIPVVEGARYTLKLHFAETWFGLNAEGGEGSRIFDVYCNGSTLLKSFDILRASGGVAGRVVVETFHNLQASPQGKLDLSFVPVVNYALVAGIEVEEE
jgi:Malectin domain